jgi:hypothetical protein
MMRRDRRAAAANPSATGRSISAGVAGGSCRGAVETAAACCPVLCASAEIRASALGRNEPSPASSETVIEFLAVGAAIASVGSGHTVATAGAGAGGRTPVCAASSCGTRVGETEGAALSSGAFRRRGSFVIALIVGAGCRLTESILTRGKDGAPSPGVAEFAAPTGGTATGVAMDGGGTDADGAASGSTCAAVCSDGWPGARRYQHLRCFAQSMW